MIGKIENRKHSVIFGNSSTIASWIYAQLFQLKNNTYLVGRKLINEEDLLADFTNYDQVLNICLELTEMVILFQFLLLRNHPFQNQRES